MSINISQKIIDALNNLLVEKDEHGINNSNVIFAMDADVGYGTKWTIHKKKVVEATEFNEVFNSCFIGCPSWIHANLIPTRGSKSLITIRAGKPIGNPDPTINVSFEVNKIIEVIE